MTHFTKWMEYADKKTRNKSTYTNLGKTIFISEFGNEKGLILKINVEIEIILIKNNICTLKVVIRNNVLVQFKNVVALASFGDLLFV